MGLEAVTIVYGNKKTILDAAVIAENNVVIADAVTAYDDAVTILNLAITTAQTATPKKTTIPILDVNTFRNAANTFKDAIKNTVNTNTAIDEYISAADNLIAEIIIEVGGNVPEDKDYNDTKNELETSVTDYKNTVTTTLVNISTYDIAAGTISTLITNADKANPKVTTILISDVNTFLTAANTFKSTATVSGSEPVTRQQINTNLNNYFTATITYIEKIISDKINEKDGTIAEKDGKINSADNTNNKLIAIKVAINELESKTMINDRVGHNFIQDKVISQYTNNILFFLYYVIFILFAVSLYLNRESYSTFLIVIILLIFGVLPFIIKYITNFAYNRFLDIAHIFYNGNARYLGPKAMPQ
jgi:hypothetical protein